jgi:hypothetical protein
MQYIPLDYNNNNIKHSGMVLMVLRSNGMLLSHFKRNRDVISSHPTPPQALYIYVIGRGGLLECEILRIPHYLENRLTDDRKIITFS